MTTACPHCGKPVKLEKLTVTVPVQTDGDLKLVKCNRCGEENLCWQKSKNDKFYLCRTRIEGGKIVALRKEFHQCQ